MARPRRAQADDPWYLSAGALLLGGPFWYGLAQGGYPLTSPEAIALPAAVAFLGACLALGVRRCPEPVRTILFAAMVVAFVELQFNLEPTLSLASRVAIVMVACVLLLAHRAQITTVAVTTLLVGGLWRPASGGKAPRPAPAGADGPPLLIHLILDSHWGPGGFRSVGDSATADLLTAFYRRWGFTLYDGAYSRYSLTRLSLGSEFGLQTPSLVDSLATDRFRLKQNPYFDYLEQRGYQIWAYQTTHLDFCSSTPGVRCVTAKANQVGNIGYLPGHWPVRAWLAGRYLLATQLPWLHRMVRSGQRNWRRSVAGGALQVAAMAQRAVATHGGPGRAFVVHLLLPHPPFDVDETCRGFPSTDARDRANEFAEGPASWMPPFAAQTRCALHALGSLLATVDSTVGRQRSVVIVQGDHGPRLPSTLGQPPPTALGDYDAATLSNHFSTLFAVRLPNVASTVVAAATPVQDLLWRLVGQDFTIADTGPWSHHVVVPNRRQSSDTLRSIPSGDMVWIRPAAALAGGRDSLGAPAIEIRP